MDEPEGKPPHAGERLTREDVLRLIEEHGGPVALDLREADLRGADLSGVDLHGAELARANLQGARLWNAKLRGAHLNLADLRGAGLSEANLQGAFLQKANLQEADLTSANLQEAYLFEADLRRAYPLEANLERAQLWDANLQGAFLHDANLQGALISGADLRGASLTGASLRDTDFEGARWGDYVLCQEIKGNFAEAASVYRSLKQRHTEAGMYDIAGVFHYREMEARRKLAWEGDSEEEEPRRLPYALAMNALRFLYGYGERPERVIGWAAAVVFGLALVHWVFGTVTGGFLDALYYSAVSFTALGYGASDSDPQGWAGRFLGAGESFVGVFMMALFLVTFTRKMTR